MWGGGGGMGGSDLRPPSPVVRLEAHSYQGLVHSVLVLF